MIDKVVRSPAEAVAGVRDGSTVLVGGFGAAGEPVQLLEALVRQGASDLTVVSNNGGSGDVGLAALLQARRVRKLVCSYPRTPGSWVFQELYRAGEIELELVPQGTLSERIRAAGAGIGGFFTRTGVGTELAAGKEVRVIESQQYVLEQPLPAEVALVKADQADRWGNLTYRKSARNYNPTMAMAARLTIVQASRVVPLGALDPEAVVTPSVYVDRVLEVS
ncbi:MAG: 3-oxoacid CoA-transferase subunit A [Nocardioidaceae bacterium]